MSIVNFIEELENENKSGMTIKVYKNCLEKFEKDTGKLVEDLVKDQRAFYKYIKELPLAAKTVQDKMYIVLKYINMMKVKGDYFDTKLNGNTEKEIKRQEIIKKTDHRKLPEKEKLIELVDTIENKEDKFILSVLLKYEVVLRCDLCLVKMIKVGKEPYLDIKKKQIVFPTINKIKIKAPIFLKLSDEDFELIDLSPRTYLIDFKTKNGLKSERNNKFSKMVSKLTLKYFGEKINCTDFRHISASTQAQDLHITPQWIDTYNKIKEYSMKRGHSIDIALNTYTQV